MHRTARRFAAILAATLSLEAGAAGAAVQVPTDFVNETVVSGLNEPVGMSFVPDGRLFVIEQRTAKIRMVVNGHLAATDPVAVVAGVNSTGDERGLLGIAVDPAWPSQPYVYVYFNRTGNKIRIARFTATGDVTLPAGENLALTQPLILIDDIPDDRDNHNGGTLRFGPDGFLYASLGEDATQCMAQDSTKLRGEILRLDVSRLGATGGGPVARAMVTPAVTELAAADSNARLVYAYGLRNPFRFQIDSATGALLVSDVGESTYEELDLITGGENLGWPYREGLHTRLSTSCTEPGGSGSQGYTPPIVELNHSIGVAALISAGIYRGSSSGTRWPAAYEGDAFFSDYYAGFIRHVRKVGANWVAPAAVAGQPNVNDWATGLTSPSDFAAGPDGALWWVSQFNASFGASSGSIQRIRYTGGAVAVGGPAASTRQLHSMPNPFASRTTVAFTTAGAELVRLAVFDVRGRHVRTLFDAQAPAGETRLAWDGRDERGATVSSGIYFIRLQHPQGIETLRTLRLP